MPHLQAGPRGYRRRPLNREQNMSIGSRRDLDGMKAAGRVVHRALAAMRAAVRPGATTAGLDAIAGAVFAEAGAQSAPRMALGFPGETCISVNDQAVHGIPGQRTLHEGDLVKLDVTAELNGYIADAAITVTVGAASQASQRLLACARQALRRAMSVARAGRRVNEIGLEVERHVRRAGFSVVRELAGHGVGRAIHEEPSIPNYFDPRDRTRLTEGLVITIEPIIAAGSGRVVEDRDGWTIRTADGSPAAHFEHTMVITRGRPLVLTGG